jgi:hypothetical protein
MFDLPFIVFTNYRLNNAARSITNTSEPLTAEMNDTLADICKQIINTSLFGGGCYDDIVVEINTAGTYNRKLPI